MWVYTWYSWVLDCCFLQHLTLSAWSQFAAAFDAISMVTVCCSIRRYQHGHCLLQHLTLSAWSLFTAAFDAISMVTVYCNIWRYQHGHCLLQHLMLSEWSLFAAAFDSCGLGLLNPRHVQNMMLLLNHNIWLYFNSRRPGSEQLCVCVCVFVCVYTLKWHSTRSLRPLQINTPYISPTLHSTFWYPLECRTGQCCRSLKSFLAFFPCVWSHGTAPECHLQTAGFPTDLRWPNETFSFSFCNFPHHIFQYCEQTWWQATFFSCCWDKWFGAVRFLLQKLTCKMSQVCLLRLRLLWEYHVM